MQYIGFFLAAVFLLGIILLYFIYLTTPKKKTKKQESAISPALVPSKWADVNAMMQQGGPANYKQSIMDADKLVDGVLRARVKGETMGERLKNAKHLFSYETYQGLWTAHKIRNKVAHEAEFEGLSSDARLAIEKFEKALRELKVI